MIELLLRNHLLADVNIKKIIARKIYANIPPQNAKGAFIVFTVVNDRDINDLQGENYSNDTLFQLDCYSSSYSKVKKLKSAVKKAMYKFKYYPHNFTNRDDYEPDTKLHKQLIEFKIKT